MNPPPPKKKGNERWGSERSCPQLHVSKTINMWNSSSDTLCLSWNLYFLNVLYRIINKAVVYNFYNAKYACASREDSLVQRFGIR